LLVLAPLADTRSMADLTALPAHLYQTLVPDGHIDPFISAIAAYGLSAGFLALVIIARVLRLRYRAVARRAEAEFSPDAPLCAGEIILHGTVEHAVKAPHAVRVEVTQEGSEAESSGSWSHSWKEVDRRLLVHPFYLRLSRGGARIRVEPDAKAYLVDDLDGIVCVNTARRVRIAELTPGEEVYVHGVLSHGLDPEASAGYRDDHHALVLRSPARRPMLLSSEPLGERFLQRARLHGGVAAFLLVVFAIWQLILLPYHARVAVGESVEATIVKLNHYTTTDSEGDVVNHYQLQTSVPRLGGFKDEVSHETFAQLREGQRVPVVVAPRIYPWVDRAIFGARASLHVAEEIVLALSLALAAVGYFYHARSSLPWYRRKVNESYSGRLPGTVEPNVQAAIDEVGKELAEARAAVKGGASTDEDPGDRPG
jgi:hypothetical protein